MSYMPNEIYVGRTRGDKLCAFEAKESDETKYIRADIAEARIAKLEDALRWYGDEKNYRRRGMGKLGVAIIHDDEGQRAREVLKDE